MRGKGLFQIFGLGVCSFSFFHRHSDIHYLAIGRRTCKTFMFHHLRRRILMIWIQVKMEMGNTMSVYLLHGHLIYWMEWHRILFCNLISLVSILLPLILFHLRCVNLCLRDVHCTYSLWWLRPSLQLHWGHITLANWNMNVHIVMPCIGFQNVCQILLSVTQNLVHVASEEKCWSILSPTSLHNSMDFLSVMKRMLWSSSPTFADTTRLLLLLLQEVHDGWTVPCSMVVAPLLSKSKEKCTTKSALCGWRMATCHYIVNYISLILRRHSSIAKITILRLVYIW